MKIPKLKDNYGPTGFGFILGLGSVIVAVIIIVVTIAYIGGRNSCQYA